MPNKTIYVSDDDLEVFRKAQELAGESISSVIVESLKKYIIDKEITELQMKKVELWDGTVLYSPNGDSAKGLRKSFYGKLLSEHKTKCIDGCVQYYALYYTKKKMFILYDVYFEQQYDEPIQEVSTVVPKNSFDEVTSMGLPYRLILEAQKNLPDIPCEELDV